MTEILDDLDWQGKVFSDGWTTARGGELKSTEPATGEVLARVGLANAADIAAAAASARRAQPGWAALPGPQRAALLRRAAGILEANRAEFERWLVREGGAIPGKAAFEVELVLGELWEAAALPTQPWGQLLPTSEPGRQSIARRVPLGVVGVISPWNFLRSCPSAPTPPRWRSASGRAKPDVQTAVSGGVLVARLFELAGLPQGVLHVLAGDAEPAPPRPRAPMSRCLAHRLHRRGRRVGEAAGRTLKRVSLELGGNNALIILDDADLDIASSAGAWGAFLHQGQVCMTAGRHIVLESVADGYLDRLAKRADNLPVGDPYTGQVALGPLISVRQLANLDRIFTETVSEGATLRAGGSHEGLFYRPTVLGRSTTAQAACPSAPVTPSGGRPGIDNNAGADEP